MRVLLSLLLTLVLAACAITPDNNYRLTPDEQTAAGSATLNEHQGVAKLYNNAAYVTPKHTLKKEQE